MPTTFCVNYALSLLMFAGVVACQGVLVQIADTEHPAVRQVWLAIRYWKKSLSLWQKFQWYTGTEPERPVKLDFPLGTIE
jgi:hypothetical protein